MAGERDIPSPQPPASTTTIYKNESYNTINRTIGHDVPPSRVRRSVSPAYAEPGKSVLIKRETTHNNVYPASQPPPPSGSSTYVYKQDVRNTTTHMQPDGAGTLPPTTTTVVYESAPPPPPGGPTQTYLYKREVTNTKNTVYGPPGGGGGSGPRSGSPQPLIEYPQAYHQAPPPHQPPQPAGPTTIMYNYSAVNTSNTRHTNSGVGPHRLPPPPLHAGDDGRQPLLPFPVETGHGRQPPADGMPPKRLDDLLATFGDVSVEAIQMCLLQFESC